MRYENEITAILTYCKQHFDKEDLPIFIVAGTLNDLETKTQIEAEQAKKAIKKMAKVGIAVDACVDSETYFMAIDKVAAIVWLMPPVQEKEVVTKH